MSGVLSDHRARIAIAPDSRQQHQSLHLRSSKLSTDVRSDSRDGSTTTLSMSAKIVPCEAPALQPALIPLQSRPSIPKDGAVNQVQAVGPVKSVWTVPQRTLPGRKPATNMPESRRKAQNRVAQRVFRERRAARVRELELEKQQILEEQAATAQQHQATLSETVAAARAEDMKTISYWRQRALTAEQRLLMLDHKTNYQHCGEPTLANYRTQEDGPHVEAPVQYDVCARDGSPREEQRDQDQQVQRFGVLGTATSANRRSLPTDGVHDAPPLPQPALTLPQVGSLDQLDMAGCGNCRQGGRCECIESLLDEPLEDVYSTPRLDTATSGTYRDPGELNAVDGVPTSYPAPDQDTAPTALDMEPIDFTYAHTMGPSSVNGAKGFRGAQMGPSRAPASLASMLPALGPNEPDSCGFCTEASTCLCLVATNTSAHADDQIYPEYDDRHAINSCSESELRSTFRQHQLAPLRLQLRAASSASSPITTSQSVSSSPLAVSAPQPVEPNSSAVGPGTCEDCLANPSLRKLCMSLPRGKPFSPPSALCHRMTLTLGKAAQSPLSETRALLPMPSRNRKRIM